ncbi:MAG TPA: SIR2 family protein [Puia sp.]|jgi:hypothetical protein
MASTGETITRLADKLSEPTERVIVIVGAGASHAAAGLPLGKELAASLVQLLDCASGEGQRQLADLLSFMNRQYGFDTDDFKTILFSLNRINGDLLKQHVQQALQKESGYNYAYAQIATLLKKRKIRGAINFNFDELLDRQMRQVFGGEEEYRYIYSDLTCPADLAEMPVEHREWLPVYCKPHGTISHPETLRFTRTDFYRIQPLQRQLLERMFTGDPVTLVVIGFRLKFYEFSTIISESLAPGSEIFIIDREEGILDASLQRYYSGGFLRVTETASLDSLMRQLAAAVERAEAQPAGIV